LSHSPFPVVIPVVMPVVMPVVIPVAIRVIAGLSILLSASASFGQTGPAACSAQSGPLKTPVLELYTSEGCSSCPPADKWLSAFKNSASPGNQAQPVVQAFHVGYWDYIGWVDRFATPAHTTRQRQIAAQNRQASIYTPQAVLDGRDWRDWHRSEAGKLNGRAEPAEANISLRQVAPDQFEALVTPLPGLPSGWSAYWTLTEDGHSSKVKSGENAGELLKHDFVVRQYTPAGSFSVKAASAQTAQTPQKLVWRSIAQTPGHIRRVNLVVVDSQSGKTLQALSLHCG
jgi:hypothetical protein